MRVNEINQKKKINYKENRDLPSLSRSVKRNYYPNYLRFMTNYQIELNLKQIYIYLKKKTK